MLEESGRLKKYADGEVIFSQGDKGNELYIIRSGKVRIARTMEGKENLLAHLNPGEFFGEMALFTEEPRWASAQAVGESEIQVVTRDDLKRIIREPVVWTMLEKMSQRLRQIDDRVEDLMVKDQVRKEHLSTLSVRNQWTS